MVEIAGRRIGESEPVYITIEAGPTHSGLDSAKRLASCVAASGADAIKFQVVDPDRLVADRKMLFSYDTLLDRETGATERVTEPLYDILCRRALTRSEWRDLRTYCRELGLAFFATAGFIDEVDFLAEIDCDSLKIASADIDHFPLIRFAARTGMLIQLDTGHATIGEVEAAVDTVRAEGNERIIIHHCPSGYPAPLDGINLRVIQTLKRMFPYPIAFSDHSPGWDMDIAAVVLGADLVEKTITEDRTARSIEHIMSLEPDDVTEFVRAMRGLEQALGSPRRIMSAEEREKRLANRRSAFLARDLPKGHILAEDDIEFRRPGFGVRPSQLDLLVGRALRRDMESGDALALADLE